VKTFYFRWFGIFVPAFLLMGVSIQAQQKIVAYVPNWVDLPAFSETIDYAKLTHINIAFENPSNSGGDLSFHAADNVLITKAHEHAVKVLVSNGGGSASGSKLMLDRYVDLLSVSNRSPFTAKIAAYISLHKFDGLDVDIEGPSINSDYGAFIHALAALLKPKGKLLTAALSKGYGGSKVPDSVFADLDWVNIMAYDALGYWDANKPGQHSSMAFARENAAYWIDRGLPKSKAVLGLPFYGYGFGDAYRKGTYSYSTILSVFPGAEKVDQIGSTLWYNGIPTIQAKTKYALDEGLAGVMIWSLDNDVQGTNSLLNAIHKTVSGK